MTNITLKEKTVFLSIQEYLDLSERIATTIKYRQVFYGILLRLLFLKTEDHRTKFHRNPMTGSSYIFFSDSFMNLGTKYLNIWWDLVYVYVGEGHIFKNINFSSKYLIQHCFICRPSDFAVSEDAAIEPKTVATLAVRHSNKSARSLPQLGYISTTIG
jgi:hypothetical protein